MKIKSPSVAKNVPRLLGPKRSLLKIVENKSAQINLTGDEPITCEEVVSESSQFIGSDDNMINDTNKKEETMNEKEFTKTNEKLNEKVKDKVTEEILPNLSVENQKIDIEKLIHTKFNEIRDKIFEASLPKREILNDLCLKIAKIDRNITEILKNIEKQNLENSAIEKVNKDKLSKIESNTMLKKATLTIRKPFQIYGGIEIKIDFEKIKLKDFLEKIAEEMEIEKDGLILRRSNTGAKILSVESLGDGEILFALDKMSERLFVNKFVSN